MTARNTTIDTTKGLGIILIVIGHNSLMGFFNYTELTGIIFSFHVPLFFFLSGVFLEETVNSSSFLLSRADSLLKPFFVVLITLGILKLIISISTGLVAAPTLQYIIGVFWANGITIAWPPLWFLPNLFIASFFALSFIKATKNLSTIYQLVLILVMLLVGIYFIDFFWYPVIFINAPVKIDSLPGLPWGLDISLITSAFVLIGYVCREQVINFSFRLIAFSISIIVFSLTHYFFNETVDLNMRIYGNPMISTIQAITGIYITLSVAVLTNRYNFSKNIFIYLGSGSLFILLFHSSPQGKIFKFLSAVNDYPLLNGLISFIAAIVFSIILWEIAKRQKNIGSLLLPKKYKVLNRGVR